MHCPVTVRHTLTFPHTKRVARPYPLQRSPDVGRGQSGSRAWRLLGVTFTMRALTGLLRLQPEATAAASRTFGSVVAADKSPFLRFASPVPTNIDTSPLLATLPETQVRETCFA
eukprot:350856-Chlamydomonas_euryale.AAC.10